MRNMWNGQTTAPTIVRILIGILVNVWNGIYSKYNSEDSAFGGISTERVLKKTIRTYNQKAAHLQFSVTFIIILFTEYLLHRIIWAFEWSPEVEDHRI